MVSIRQSVHIYKYRGIGEPPKKGKEHEGMR